MFKKIVVSLIFILAINSFAQEATSSPYSFYGIGEIKFKGAVENRSMGGLSVFKDSIHLNLSNPASYSGLKNIVFAVAGNTNETTLSSKLQEAKTKRTSLDYLALALPITKNLGVSTGLISYSSVGFNVTQNITDPNATTSFKTSTGSGGLNKVFVGAAYNIFPELSAGLNVDFNFGKISTNNLRILNNIEYGTNEVNNININGVNFTAGLMYESKFKSKLQVSAGLTFTPAHNLTFVTERTFFTVKNPAFLGTDFLETIAVLVPDVDDKVPAKVSFGLGIGKSKKWEFGSEVVLQGTNNFGGKFSSIANVKFENTTEIRIGGYFIPKYNSFDNYFKRIVYKAGINYKNLGMVINGKSINEQTLTAGLGLPLYGVFSNINIGFEIGKRGTKMGGLIQENFKTLTIGLSLNDLWFKRTRYE